MCCSGVQLRLKGLVSHALIHASMQEIWTKKGL
eukprot:SAG11_NODE_21852_length_417_cov_0.971698_1_plen_32_part_01